MDILQLGEPREAQKLHYIKFFENGIAKWISNLLSRDRIYYLKIKIYQVLIEFIKSRSNLLSQDQNLLSRDQIYYLKIEIY